MTNRTIAVAAALAALLAGSRLRAAAGPEAPAFELRTLDGKGMTSSGDLFGGHAHVFVVFWSAGCPHCVEALRGAQTFYRRYGGPDIAVVGITADETDVLTLREMLETNGVAFPQLRDPGGLVSRAYGVPFETLVIIRVTLGAVAGKRVDVEGDVGAAMEEMLFADASPDASAVAPAAPAAAAPEDSRFGPSIRGWSRIRLLAIDSRGADASGLYGEPIRPGSRLEHRTEIEGSASVAGRFRAGALLRISNESDRVLESGPKYLGSSVGSAFAEVEWSRLAFRLGYYSLFMTPLTLMRWDWDDNPRVGGDAGCGCGAAAGSLLIESLDDLAPELTFEGALARCAVPGGDLRIFYAVPRRARETPRVAWVTGAEDRAHYSLELYGAEWRWRRSSARTGGSWKAGARFVGTREDRNSVDFVALGYPVSDPWRESGIATVSAEAPLVRFVRARAEGVVWNRMTERGTGGSGDTIASRMDGRAGIAGFLFDGPRRSAFALEYVFRAPGFYSPFAALSYEPNWKGYRASARGPLFRARANLDLFFKRMREHTPPAGGERAGVMTVGASIASDLDAGFGATSGWVEEREERAGAILPYTLSRRAFEAGLQKHFSKSGVMELRYNRVRNEESSPFASSRTTVDLYALYTTIRF